MHFETLNGQRITPMIRPSPCIELDLNGSLFYLNTSKGTSLNLLWIQGTFKHQSQDQTARAAAFTAELNASMWANNLGALGSNQSFYSASPFPKLRNVYPF